MVAPVLTTRTQDCHGPNYTCLGVTALPIVVLRCIVMVSTLSASSSPSPRHSFTRLWFLSSTQTNLEQASSLLKETEMNEEEKEEECTKHMLLTFFWSRLITTDPGQYLDCNHYNLSHKVVLTNNLAIIASATAANLAVVAPLLPQPWPSQSTPPPLWSRPWPFLS